MLVLPYG